MSQVKSATLKTAPPQASCFKKATYLNWNAIQSANQSLKISKTMRKGSDWEKCLKVLKEDELILLNKITDLAFIPLFNLEQDHEKVAKGN